MNGKATAARDDRDSLTAFLRQVQPFSTVRSQWLERLELLVDGIELAAHETLFRAGEPADAIYVLRSGRIAMFTDTPGRPVHLVARVGPGEVLGMVGALGGSRRIASARAAAPCRLLRLDRADLLDLVEADSFLGLRFILAVVARHARNTAAALELGNRHDIRIRVDREVDLVVSHRKRIRVRLANLSRGGVCFSGALQECFPEPPTWYAVHNLDGDLLLRFNGRVAWRQGHRAGLAFCDRVPAHDLLVQGALRQLLRSPRPAAPAAATGGRRLTPVDTSS